MSFLLWDIVVQRFHACSLCGLLTPIKDAEVSKLSMSEFQSGKDMELGQPLQLDDQIQMVLQNCSGRKKIKVCSSLSPFLQHSNITDNSNSFIPFYLQNSVLISVKLMIFSDIYFMFILFIVIILSTSFQNIFLDNFSSS